VSVAVLIASVVALVIMIIVLVIRHERRRAQEFERLAQEIGLTFHAKGDAALLDQLNRFHLFSQGRSKKMRNLVFGETEYGEVAVFGYQYTTGSGKNSSTTRQNVAYFRSTGLKAPSFALRPEHVFHKIGTVMGYQDIDFDSHEHFSKKYLLRGADEAAVREAFRSEVLSFYETQSGISTEADGERLIYYRSGRRIKPSEMMTFLNEGSHILKLFQA